MSFSINRAGYRPHSNNLSAGIDRYRNQTTAFNVKRRRKQRQRFLRSRARRTGHRASPTSKTRFYAGAAVDLVSVREIERTASEWNREERSETDEERARAVEMHRGERGPERDPRDEGPKGWSRIEGDGAKRASGPGPSRGPVPRAADEKSVIIIITAERATIINHH